MNSLNELVSHGISISTAEKMIEEYKRRIGTMNGIYEITDITYDFTEKGKDVTLRCTQCGKVIHRMMINGRNKWSELIKTCDCQKEQKKRESEIAEKIKKDKIREEIGKEYGDYIVQDVIFGNPDKLLMKCKECGSEIFVSHQNVKSGKWQNQACEKHKEREFKYNRSYIGQKKNYLTVIDIVRDKENRMRFLCKCDCGNTKTLQPCYWENGRIKSCGCMHDELVSTHGGSKDRLYKVWQDMKRRCYKEYCKSYDNYGGRGISVCDEWRNDYQAFKDWAYSHGYDDHAKIGDCTIDRINVNGDYEPSNCRWIDIVAQNKNKRPPSEWKKRKVSPRVFTIINGEKIYTRDLQKIFGVSRETFLYRVKTKGMTPEQAVSAKKMAKGRPRKIANAE